MLFCCFCLQKGADFGEEGGGMGNCGARAFQRWKAKHEAAAQRKTVKTVWKNSAFLEIWQAVCLKRSALQTENTLTIFFDAATQRAAKICPSGTYWRRQQTQGLFPLKNIALAAQPIRQDTARLRENCGMPVLPFLINLFNLLLTKLGQINRKWI